MARLEIDLQAKGFKQVASEAGQVEKALGSLESKTLVVSKNIQTLTNSSNQLEGKLNSLKTQFQSGAISQSQYEKSSKAVSTALENVRGRISSLQSQQKSLTGTLAQTTSETTKQGAALNRLQGYHKSFASGIRSTNTIAVELSRIIQDAPYGLQGVANNVQQLTQNYAKYARAAKEAAVAQGQTLTTGSLLRGALSSFISPLNLLTIGISAVTAGWVAYENWSRKSAKATEESKKKSDELVKSLGNVSTALYNASVASGSEIAKLQTLYRVATDIKAPMDARLKAVKDLKAEAPAYLKDLSDEAILTGTAKKAYDELTASIIATARARAAEGAIGERSARQFAIDEANKELEKQIKLVDERIKQQEYLVNNVGQSVGAVSESIDSGNVSRLNKLYKERNSLNDQETKNLLDRAKIQEEINELSDVAAKNRSTVTKDLKEQTASTKTLVDYVSKLNDIEQKSIFSSTLATEETSLDKQVERIRQKYFNLAKEVDKVEKQGLSDSKNNANTRNQITEAALSARKQNEVSQSLEIAEATRIAEQKTADIISGILDKANVARVSSREKDLQANKAFYDEQERVYRDNAQILESITIAREARIAQINEDWNSKALSEAQKIQDKINDIANKPFSSTASNDNIQKELDKRLKQIEEFYAKIREILKASGLPTTDIDSLEEESKRRVSSGTTDNDAKKQEEKFSKIIERGLRSGFSDVFNDINNLGSNFYEVFSNVFGKLANTVTNTFGQLLSTQLGDLLSSKINSESFDVAGLGSTGSKIAVAGGGLLGGILSSQGIKKNNAALTIGGSALSGAAAGTAILPGWGTAIGAVVGAIAGIFQSAGAKKQEKIQEAQLAEQRKQTFLAERAAALAFTSSIIGQQTASGIVTSVDRNEFGQVVFRIEGKDLVASLNRENNGR